MTDPLTRNGDGEQPEHEQSLSLDRVQAVLRLVTRVPRIWAVTLLIAAIVSTLRLDLSTDSELSGSFEPTALTAVLLALIWLPSLLRVIALAGGGVKTPAGEASTGGLLDFIKGLDPDTKREALPPLLAALSSPEVFVDADRRHTSRPIRHELEMQLAAATPHGPGVRELLESYAQEYERVRNEMPPARERTLRMTSLMAEARATARATPLSVADLQHMASEGSDGERAIALAIIQDRPNSRLFPVVARAIEESHSAFEQFQALGAALEMLDSLDDAQRKELSSILKRAIRDRNRAIKADASRARLVDGLLHALGEEAPQRAE